MLHQVVIQILGVIATILSLAVFQVNNRRTMLIIALSASLMWTAHYSVLGAVTGALLNLLGAVRWYVFSRITPSRKNIWILGIFIVAAVIAVLLTEQSRIGLLPMAAVIVSGVAFWQKKPKLIRRLNIASNPLWLVYNAFVGSYPGIIVEILLLLSNIVGQYRFDITHKLRPFKHS